MCVGHYALQFMLGHSQGSRWTVALRILIIVLIGHMQISLHSAIHLLWCEQPLHSSQRTICFLTHKNT